MKERGHAHAIYRVLVGRFGSLLYFVCSGVQQKEEGGAGFFKLKVQGREEVFEEEAGTGGRMSVGRGGILFVFGAKISTKGCMPKCSASSCNLQFRFRSLG